MSRRYFDDRYGWVDWVWIALLGLAAASLIGLAAWGDFDICRRYFPEMPRISCMLSGKTKVVVHP